MSNLTAATYTLEDVARLARCSDQTAWRLARIWATGPLAVWAATEVHRAWEQSGR